MAVFKTQWFDRWARKEGLSASSLCAAVREMQHGLVDADLGGGLVKKLIGRPGHGKSGGYRTLVATNKGNRWVFVFGCPKKRAQQDRQGRNRGLEEVGGKPVVIDAASARLGRT